MLCFCDYRAVFSVNWDSNEIAYTIGYAHASSFIRAFERRFAQAPARYRKQNDYTKC